MFVFREIIQNKKYILILLVVLAVSAFLVYSFVSPRGLFSGLSNDLKNIEPSEEFSYTDIDGNKVDLTQFKGKPLIINAWASWMPFSRNELTMLAKVKESRGDTLNVIAMNRMEAAGVIRAYKDGFNLPNSFVYLLDPSDNFYKSIGGYAMPETMFYDRDGVLIHHKRGVLTESELNQYTDAIFVEN